MRSDHKTIPGFYLVDAFLRSVISINNKLSANPPQIPTVADANNMQIALQDLLRDKTYDQGSKALLMVENILKNPANLKAIESVYQLTKSNPSMSGAKSAIETLHVTLKDIHVQMGQRGTAARDDIKKSEDRHQQNLDLLVKALETCVTDAHPDHRAPNIEKLAVKLLALSNTPDKSLEPDAAKLIQNLHASNPQAGIREAVQEAYKTSDLLTQPKPPQKGSTAMLAQKAPGIVAAQPQAQEAAKKALASAAPPASREAKAANPKADWKAQETAQKDAGNKPKPEPEKREEVTRSRGITIGNRK
jgi:hypothetical protein